MQTQTTSTQTRKPALSTEEKAAYAAFRQDNGRGFNYALEPVCEDETVAALPDAYSFTAAEVRRFSRL